MQMIVHVSKILVLIVLRTVFMNNYRGTIILGQPNHLSSIEHKGAKFPPQLLIWGKGEVGVKRVWERVRSKP